MRCLRQFDSALNHQRRTSDDDGRIYWMEKERDSYYVEGSYGIGRLGELILDNRGTRLVGNEQA